LTENLANLKGLENLEQATDVSITNASGLTTLVLAGLKAVERLELDTLDSTTRIQLPSLETANYIGIENHDLLSLEMDALTSVSRDLVIGANPNLETLNGLPSLMSVGGNLSIVNNLKLPQCEVDAIAVRLGGCQACTGNDAMAVCH